MVSSKQNRVSLTDLDQMFPMRRDTACRMEKNVDPIVIPQDLPEPMPLLRKQKMNLRDLSLPCETGAQCDKDSACTSIIDGVIMGYRCVHGRYQAYFVEGR